MTNWGKFITVNPNPDLDLGTFDYASDEEDQVLQAAAAIAGRSHF